MITYDIDPINYIKTDEVLRLFEFLKKQRLDRVSRLKEKYPLHIIRSRVDVDSIDYKNNQYYYCTHFKVPFFENDVFESLLHKDRNGYLEIVEFTDTMNIFCKTIFHRKFWSDNTNSVKDNFLYFIYDLWKKHQISNQFDQLEKAAIDAFKNSKDMVEYYQNFVYNNHYKFINLDQMKELFDQLIERKLWIGKIENLYQVYNECEYDSNGIDTKVLFHSGKVSKISELQIRAAVKNHMKILESLDTEFNFIPIDDPTNRFDGFWNAPKIGSKIWYVPLFLIFYNPNAKNKNS